MPKQLENLFIFLKVISHFKTDYLYDIIRIGDFMKKYDEREILFARLELIKGTKEYEDFYRKNSEYKDQDDSLRRISFRDNLKKDDDFKKLFFPLVSNNKLFIKSLHDLVDNYPLKTKQKIDQSFAKNIKEITKYYGATDVGITKLDESSYYSHSGGLSEALGIDSYNKVIKAEYKTAIVFTVKMDLEMMNRAPNFEELMTTEEGYLKIAQVGARLSVYLKSLGYDAFLNSSELYLAPLVPLAYDAGLGEIGLTNHLVTLEHGDNVRIGAVFTNLELAVDQPIDFGLVEFCKRCALCLINCPTNCITHLPRIVNGRQFYKFDDNLCYEMWTKVGTDCGVCIQSCPFTQGVDLEKVKQMKGNQKIMDEIVRDHLAKYGRRKYTKKDLDIVKLKGDKK